jgi:hypothetical protein
MSKKNLRAASPEITSIGGGSQVCLQEGKKNENIAKRFLKCKLIILFFFRN